MSQWGLYGDPEEGTIQYHMAPWKPDGRFPLRHSKSEFCQCHPKAFWVGEVCVLIHQDAERGADQPT